MVSVTCWRCLARPTQKYLVPLLPSAASSAAFTTSAGHLAADGPINKRKGKMLILGGKKWQRGKRPDRNIAPGERKAFRKRVQLSNNNALPVPGLPLLTSRDMVEWGSVGQMVRLGDGLVDQLRAVEAFKPTQNWALFRSPHILIRTETVDFIKQMTETVERRGTFRAVIDGSRESGKSILGLQALAAGFMKGWLVINLPEGQDLTNAHTEYAPIPNTNQFSQPTYVIKLMQAIYTTNERLLTKFRVGLDHFNLPVSVPRGMTLAQMLNVTKEPELAWPIFHAFWRELLMPHGPPILFIVDGLSHIMRVSDYRAPNFEPIHSHDLGLLRLFVESLGGTTSFPNGAAIIGVQSKSNARKSKSLDLAMEQAVAIQKGKLPPIRDPFYRGYDERVFDALRGVKVFDIKGVSKQEARSLLEYWAASGVLRMRVDEKSVSERWSLAGNGTLGEMERASLYAIRL